jgi:hypothetical protein
MVILGGWVFLMSKVPLYPERHLGADFDARRLIEIGRTHLTDVHRITSMSSEEH